MKYGHHANAWGGVVGHPVGVTSIKDLFYLTPGDTLGTIAEVAAAGYQGIELFDGNLAEYADDQAALRGALEEHDVALVGVYSGANLIFGEILAEELWRVRRACAWAAEHGAEHLVIGGGAQRAEPATQDDYVRLAGALDEVERIAEGHGLVASYHPHLSTIVETPEQIEMVLSRTAIRFCPDTGHLQAAGGDPVELVRAYRDRIDYVHLKDLDAAGGFVPLGEGSSTSAASSTCSPTPATTAGSWSRPTAGRATRRRARARAARACPSWWRPRPAASARYAP
jgi:inosose dehydratase